MLAGLALAPVLLLAGCSGDHATTPAPATAGTLAGLETSPSDPSHEHATGALRYDQAPPVGGRHNPRWLRCAVYDEMPPLEVTTHSLEHGAVWLAYRPGTSAVDVAALVALREASQTSREWGLVAPYDNLRAPVVAVTWGASLAVDSAQDPRLRAFMDAYAGGGQGGERGVPCASADGALTVDQARALLASQG
ncbi:MAG: hypothetical protein JWL64_1486 [Frankiales bacterium]|nr:hypothetical protein [Frankiales bacterium]